MLHDTVGLCYFLPALAHALLSNKAIAARHSGQLNPHPAKQWNHFLHNGTVLAHQPNPLVIALPPELYLTGENTIAVRRLYF